MRGLPIAFLLLCSACSMAGGTDDSTQLKIADVALANGVPKAALQVSHDILARDQNNLGALLRQAEAEYLLGELNQAEGSFNRVLSIQPRQEQAMLGLGRVFLKKDPSKASGYLEQAVAEAPDDISALVDLGVAHDLVGDHGRAQALYRKVLARQPDLVTAGTDLGLSLALAGKGDEAVGYLQPLASDAGASSRIKDDLAMALVVTGNTTAAGRILEADMKPQDAQAAISAYGSLGHASP